MTNLFCMLLLSWGLFSHSAQGQPFLRDPSSTPGRIVHIVVEKRPEFPGGVEKLTRYLRKNRNHVAQKDKAESSVFLNFIVNETGVLEEVRVLKGISPRIDAEALRLVRAMPKWIPGQQAGHAVACRFFLPVRFPVPSRNSYKATLLRIIN